MTFKAGNQIVHKHTKALADQLKRAEGLDDRVLIEVANYVGVTPEELVQQMEDAGNDYLAALNGEPA